MRVSRAVLLYVSICLLVYGCFATGSVLTASLTFAAMAVITAVAQIALRGSSAAEVIADLVVAAQLSLIAIAVGIDPYTAYGASFAAAGGVAYGFVIQLSWDLGDAG